LDKSPSVGDDRSVGGDGDWDCDLPYEIVTYMLTCGPMGTVGVCGRDGDRRRRSWVRNGER
jgi:hypothetical protein